MILQSIQADFPKSFVRNDKVFYNIDVDKLKHMSRGNTMPSVIYLSDATGVFFDDYSTHSQDVEVHDFKLKIYSYNQNVIFDNQSFWIDYNKEDLGILDTFNTKDFQ